MKYPPALGAHINQEPGGIQMFQYVLLRLIITIVFGVGLPAVPTLAKEQPEGLGCYESRVVNDYYTTIAMHGVEAGLDFQEDMIRFGQCFRTHRIPTELELVRFVTVLRSSQRVFGYTPIQHDGKEAFLVGSLNISYFERGIDA